MYFIIPIFITEDPVILDWSTIWHTVLFNNRSLIEDSFIVLLEPQTHTDVIHVIEVKTTMYHGGNQIQICVCLISGISEENLKKILKQCFLGIASC